MNHKTNIMQPSKTFSWPSTRKQFSQLRSTCANNQECIYPLVSFHLFSIASENHQFRVSSSRGAARIFFGRGLNVGFHVWQKFFWGFRLIKMFKFGYFSIYFTHLKLPLLSLFFLHITPRIFSVNNLLQATYTFT